MKTKFINGTNCEITLKEANSGMQRFLHKLGKRDHLNPNTSTYEMQLDMNATYREYHLFVMPSCGASTMMVSSDNLIDNKVITTIEVEGGFTWKGTPRKNQSVSKKAEEEARSSEDGQGASTTKTLTRWLSGGLSKLLSKSVSSIEL